MVVSMFMFCQDDLQPLHIACQMGHSSCVKVLIEDCHADPNCRAKVHMHMCTYVYVYKLYVHEKSGQLIHVM